MSSTVSFSPYVSAPTTLSAVDATGDWIVAGFGTPEAAIVIEAGTATGDGLAANLFEGITFFDGINIRSLSSADQDAQTTINTSMRGSNTRVINQKVGNVVGLTATAAMITDGVRFTCTTRSTPQVNRWGVLLFKGLAGVKVGSVQASTTVGGTTAVTGIGFKPDLCMFINSAVDFFPNDSTNYSNQVISRGVATRETAGIVQGCTSYFNEDGLADSLITQRVSNAYVAERITASSTLLADVAVASWDTDGFTLRTDATAGNCFIGYMAMKFSGDHPECKISTYSSGAGADGTKIFTGYSGTVQTIIQYSTLCPTVNTSYTASEDSGAYGYSFATTAAAYGNASIVSTPNAAAANNGVVYNGAGGGTIRFMNLYRPSDLSTHVQGNMSSFDSTGFKVILNLNGAAGNILGLTLAICAGDPPADAIVYQPTSVIFIN